MANGPFSLGGLILTPNKRPPYVVYAGFRTQGRPMAVVKQVGVVRLIDRATGESREVFHFPYEQAGAIFWPSDWGPKPAGLQSLQDFRRGFDYLPPTNCRETPWLC